MLRDRTVWIVWQEGNGLLRIYATEQEANSYAEAVFHPEGETSVVPYPVIGGERDAA